MKLPKASTIFWIATNSAGLGGYYWACSMLWADEPGGVGMAMDGNTAISWIITAFPFMAACALINTTLLGIALWRLIQAKDWRPLLIWAMVMIGWIFVIVLVRTHVRA